MSLKHGRPKNKILDLIVNEVRTKLGLTLFGIDVIIEKGSGRYAIIDMNVFPGKLYTFGRLLTFYLLFFPSPTIVVENPGYDGVPNFLEDLADLMIEEVKQKEKGDSNFIPQDKGNEKAIRSQNDDSGIDTSDSCDEKKPLQVRKEERITRMKHVRGSVNNI